MAAKEVLQAATSPQKSSQARSQDLPGAQEDVGYPPWLGWLVHSLPQEVALWIKPKKGAEWGAGEAAADPETREGQELQGWVPSSNSAGGINKKRLERLALGGSWLAWRVGQRRSQVKQPLSPASYLKPQRTPASQRPTTSSLPPQAWEHPVMVSHMLHSHFCSLYFLKQRITLKVDQFISAYVFGDDSHLHQIYSNILPFHLARDRSMDKSKKWINVKE